LIDCLIDCLIDWCLGVGGVLGPSSLSTLSATIHQGKPGEQEGQN